MDDDRRSLATASFAAAFLLALLCALTLATGTSQQGFEWARPPDAYAAALTAHASALRLLIGIDDAFIAAYVTATVLFAKRLANGRWVPIPLLVLAGGVAAGTLDLEENHHLLAMLGLAEGRVALPVTEILHRATLSPMKWMLGHVAFVLAGVALPAREPLARTLRLSLLAVQLPVGAACWVVTDPGVGLALTWARYLAMLAGFATIGLLTARETTARGAAFAVARDAPA